MWAVGVLEERKACGQWRGRVGAVRAVGAVGAVRARNKKEPLLTPTQVGRRISGSVLGPSIYGNPIIIRQLRQPYLCPRDIVQSPQQYPQQRGLAWKVPRQASAPKLVLLQQAGRIRRPK